MEFKEFSNPENQDYDIKSSLKENENNTNKKTNPFELELMDLIGILDNINEEELQAKYGISVKEYLNPNQQTIIKVSKKLGVSYNPEIEGLKIR